MTEIPTQITMSNLVLTSVNRALATALRLLDKAQSHAADKKIKDETLMGTRLIADMLPFAAQIRIVTDNAKGAVARLSGVTAPVFEDNETTLDELRARINKALEFINSVDAKLLENTEAKEVVLKFPSATFEFVGLTYVVGFLLPNINFHLTTAYDILRTNGVNLTKSDYLGG